MKVSLYLALKLSGTIEQETHTRSPVHTQKKKKKTSTSSNINVGSHATIHLSKANIAAPNWKHMTATAILKQANHTLSIPDESMYSNNS